MEGVSVCAEPIVGWALDDDSKRAQRLDKWLAAEPQPLEEQIWVGRGYSLAQLKLDVEAELEFQKESASWPVTDW